MATSAASLTTAEELNSEYGSDVDFGSATMSDYGSDFDVEEEALVGELLAQHAANVQADALLERTLVYSAEENNDATQPTLIVHASPPSAIVRVADSTVGVELSPGRRTQPVEVEYNDHSRDSWRVPGSQLDPHERATKPSRPDEHVKNDIRSPLQRFRTMPKKPLSVTDLVSPAWCELQYWYNLTKFGRKPQTQAMKQGSKVHKVLEEQVHKSIPIRVQSKEDRFGLRLWNTIQGLRSLRDTGLTRELEIWGVIDGQVVNGVIDEVSYTCPDPAYEEALEQSKMKDVGGMLPPGQLSIEQSLVKAGTSTGGWTDSASHVQKTYISDVKTRGVRSVPAGASLRPTWMQLMVYRKILESLALNTVDAESVFVRYDVAPLVPFTETFVRELGGIRQSGEEDEMPDEDPPASRQATEIVAHNNLSALWSLMISEFKQCMGSFSDVLRAEFRYSKTGEIIGNEVFAYSDKQIEEYLADEMEWWKGAREARGVEIEEAFKCRVCPFADDCTWRKNKIEEATEKYRLRIASRAKSAV